MLANKQSRLRIFPKTPRLGAYKVYLLFIICCAGLVLLYSRGSVFPQVLGLWRYLDRWKARRRGFTPVTDRTDGFSMIFYLTTPRLCHESDLAPARRKTPVECFDNRLHVHARHAATTRMRTGRLPDHLWDLEEIKIRDLRGIFGCGFRCNVGRIMSYVTGVTAEATAEKTSKARISFFSKGLTTPFPPAIYLDALPQSGWRNHRQSTRPYRDRYRETVPRHRRMI